jgi:hypothetical protein
VRQRSSGAGRRCARRNRGGRGFALVEVLLSGFVMTITVLGVAASVATSGGIGDRSRDEMRARRAVQSWIYDIQSRHFASVGYTMHGLAFDVVGLMPIGDDPDGHVGEIAFSEGPVPDTYFVDVRVRWENRGGEREVRSHVVLSNVMGEAGRTPTMSALDAAAAMRLAAPTTLTEILELGESLLDEKPSAKWADALTLAMDHVREAGLLLGTAPMDRPRVLEQLSAGLAQVEVALGLGLDSTSGDTMVQEISAVIAGLGGE